MRRMQDWRGMTSATVLVMAATGPGQALTPANALASTKTVTITVTGVSRTGVTLAVPSEVTPLHGNTEPETGPT